MTRTSVPRGFDEIHRILGNAMRAAPPDTWPARPHLGGPLPVLSTRQQAELGFVVGRRAQALATGDERTTADRMLALAESILDLGAKRFTKTAIAEKDAIDKACRGSTRDSPLVRAAKLTARAAFNDRWSSPSARNVAGTCVERAAEAVVTHLAGNTDAIRAFLAELDAATLRIELAGLLADKALPATAITRVLSRPKATKGKSLGLVFAELATGHGLFVKLKQRWHWHEGDRATMFATVPDEYMEQVIEDIEPEARLRQTLRRSRA